MVNEKNLWLISLAIIVVACLAGYMVLSKDKKNSESLSNIVSERAEEQGFKSSPMPENDSSMTSKNGKEGSTLAESDVVAEQVSHYETDTSPAMDNVNRVEEALQSMRSSLGQVDPRTPEMSEPYQRELPTPEELSDPALYEAYEVRQSKKMASVYSAVTKEIPLIRNRIEAAKLDGSRTQEEISEAEEALSKMEELSELIQLQEPELVEELDNTIADVDEVADKVTSGEVTEN